MSYASENEADIRRLADTLRDEGYDVYWDTQLRSGKSWRQQLSEKLDEAGCIVVAWSNASVGSDYVIEEAEEGRRRQILRPVLLDANPKLPFGFRNIQAEDLSAWDGSPDAPAYRQLLQTIKQVLDGTVSTRPPRGTTVSISQSQLALIRLLAIIYSVALVIGWASLYFSYGPYTSQAWTVEYGWALSAWPKGEVVDDKMSNLGGWWEGLRALMIAVGSLLFFGFAGAPSVLEFLGLRQHPPSRRLWLRICQILTIVALLVAAVVLVLHHVNWGPSELAEGGQMWQHHADFKASGTPRQPSDAGYRESYVTPYRLYFAYSAVVILVLGMPFLGIGIYASGVEFSYGRGWGQTLREGLDEADTCPNLRSVFEAGCLRRSGAIERQSYAALALSLIFCFEYFLGQYTLSQGASAWAWLVYGLLAISVIILVCYVVIYVPLARHGLQRSINPLQCEGESRLFFDRSQGALGFYRRILHHCWPFHMATVVLVVIVVAAWMAQPPPS